MTSRRSFLAALAGALTLDPERALWVPGAKLISIPKPPLEYVPSGIAFEWTYDPDSEGWSIAAVRSLAQAPLPDGVP